MSLPCENTGDNGSDTRYYQPLNTGINFSIIFALEKNRKERVMDCFFFRIITGDYFHNIADININTKIGNSHHSVFTTIDVYLLLIPTIISCITSIIYYLFMPTYHLSFSKGKQCIIIAHSIPNLHVYFL